MVVSVMTRGGSDDVSLLGLGTAVLRHRWRIVRWTLLGGLVAGIWAFMTPAKYIATAALVPEAPDAGASKLAGLAGQFGVALPTGGGQSSQSPDFYLRLLQSRVLLGRIATDTFEVPELARRRVSFSDLFEIGGSPELRQERSVALLRQFVGATVTKSTGLVELSVSTPYRSVSLAIADSLVAGLNTFNQRVRHTQASSERQFVEGRLQVASADLRAAEERLNSFLLSNRQFMSPVLDLQNDRLKRDLAMKQAVYTSLAQSYEEVRLREVRDTPVITVVEPPAVPPDPAPRGRVVRTLLGLVFGAFVGLTLAVVIEALARRRRVGDAAVQEFIEALGEARGRLFRRTPAAS